MVDGVHGHVDGVLEHVVVEHSNVVENVIVLYLPVEEIVVLAQVLKYNLALVIILVRSKFNTY